MKIKGKYHLHCAEVLKLTITIGMKQYKIYILLSKRIKTSFPKRDTVQ